LCLGSQVAVIDGTTIRVRDCGTDKVLHLYIHRYIYLRGEGNIYLVICVHVCDSVG
jgi:hypothetical protein